MNIFVRLINKLKYWLLALFLLPIFSVWVCNAKPDLMQQMMEPAKYAWTTIYIWDSVDRVWKQVIEWSHNIVSGKSTPSIIIRATRTLLGIVIAISVTMILYNGMVYIMETWRWKEWKSLVKNVIYIVVWIIVSLFSVTIITLLQSVSTTLKNETQDDRNQIVDDRLIDGDKKWLSLAGLLGL